MLGFSKLIVLEMSLFCILFCTKGKEKSLHKRKITYSAGGSETENDFVLVGEKYRKYMRDIKVIPWELQHRPVVVDLDKKILKKGVRKKQIIRRGMWKLNENRTRVRFEKRVKELVSTDAPDLWKIFKDGVLKACDEVNGNIKETCCGGMKRSRIP